jgi:hypothetical protein
MKQFNGSVRGAALGIFYNNSKRCANLEEFENNIAASEEVLTRRHKDFKIDELLEIRHGAEWLDQINSIVYSKSN